MHCFYLGEHIIGEQAVLSDVNQVHHVKDVLRLKKGFQITVFDSAGHEFLCSISGFSQQQVLLQVIEKKAARPVKFKLTLACAIPKKSGFDDIVDKLTQIGVDTIIPLLTERVEVRIAEAEGSRLERWRKIACSAAEQSQRNTLPSIPGILSYANILAKAAEYDLKLVPNLSGDRLPLHQALNGREASNILVLIGPEGDFTPQEIEQALTCGFQAVTLGENVLRVETAAVAVASYLRLALN
jgi:16S rRNA (uracil1498-N3)-methyltransferase